MPHRPGPEPIPAASSSSIIVQHVESTRLFPLFAQLSFHVVPAKIEGELGNVYSWIEELGGRCVNVEAGKYVVTALRGRARLERVLGRRYLVSLRLNFAHIDYQTNRIDRLRTSCISASPARACKPR